MASTSAYARMQLPSIYHIWISAAARQNVTFNAILISTLKSCLSDKAAGDARSPTLDRFTRLPPIQFKLQSVFFARPYRHLDVTAEGGAGGGMRKGSSECL